VFVRHDKETNIELEKKLIDNKDVISKPDNNLLDNDNDDKMVRKVLLKDKKSFPVFDLESDDEECFAVHPELPNIPVDNINICFVGGVSTGKSTILNAIFCEELTQCKIKRTTMVPTIYVENENDTENITSPDLIFTTISDINKKIIEKTETGQPIDRSEYRELVFNVGKLDINILNGSYVNVYDIPGLNDVRTKDIYYSYLDDNFTKFNLVVLIVDIHSGLNTSDEMQIVDYITTHTREEMEKNNKNIYTLVVVNKADYMQLEDESDDKLILTGELNEMFEQVQNTISAEFTKRNIKDNLIGIIPLCALDSYLYRMVKKNGKKFKLSQEQILKIGINEDGKKFSKLKPATQENKVYEILANKEFIDDMIKLSGFSHLESILHKFLSENNVGKQIRVNNLLFELKKLPNLYNEVLLAAPVMSSRNIINLIEKYIKILDILKKIDYDTYENEMLVLSRHYISALEVIIKSSNDISNIINNYKKANKEIIEPYFELFFISIFGNEEDTMYPDFLKKRVISLIAVELKDKVITLGNIVLAFAGLKEVASFTKPNVEHLIDIILTNCNSHHTISAVCEKNTNDMDSYTIELFIKLLDECVSLNVNISRLLRFVFICLYRNYDEIKLIKIKMLLTKHGEIPLNMYVSQINQRIDAYYYYSYYLDGLKEQDYDNFELEMYYLSHEKKYNPINFVGN
jgi:GTP-binding protein EngB required for normal cell division